MTSLPDQEHRELALDTGNSFIVQAPAGSGKTELLSLRYLSLLGICDEPEEVLAITFTRKAASEMKDRILSALKVAERDGAAARFDDPLRNRRHQIASAALSRAADRNWNLLANPGRLKIQTIDSFCLNLANRIPLLSRLGGNPNQTDDVEPCFQAAISATLASLNENNPLSDDIALLLRHLDNDIARVEKLLAGLLENRDQWSGYILDLYDGQQTDRDYLQDSLLELIGESLDEVNTLLQPYESELVPLLNHAGKHLPESHKHHIADYQPLTRLPDNDPDSMTYWQLLVAILLTQKGTWRQKISVRDGFPASVAGDKEQTARFKAMKEQWSAVLEQLDQQEELRQALAYLALLPDPELEDRQWEFLTALARILHTLNGQLLLAFRQFNLVDYSQVAAAALGALGTEEHPTDLALALDHRIKHILVDEFQDTSWMQTDLLRLMTAGWEPQDGRTLFLVGDPMQSVYGFRNANVGIYLRVQEKGLADLPLQPLTLQSNFRSQSNIVAWVNQVFAGVFPVTANSSRGAVPYSPSVAQKAAIPNQGISVELISYEEAAKSQAQEMEAKLITNRVLRIKQEEPDASIAILVRSRSQLLTLIPELRTAGIQWQATDIDKLDSLPVIDDLQSLTRALLNLGDSIAWLAILRAPWCGLTLADLHAVVMAAGDQSIWSSVQNHQQIPALSADGKERLADFTRVLSYVLALRNYHNLHQLVESAWSLLRGAALAIDEAEQASVACFLELLKKHELGGTLRDYQDFSSKVTKAFIPSRTERAADDAVHVMTMHKAKGLEFDHVILPSLGAKSGHDSKKLLEWHERLNQHGQSKLFIAALSPSGSDEDPLYQLLRFENKRKSEYEDLRLLYIATTRARKTACLTAILQRNDNGEVKPTTGSLLSQIWPQLQTMNEDQCCVHNLEDLAPSQQTPSTDRSDTHKHDTVTPIQRFKQPLKLGARELGFIERLHDFLPEPPDTDFETLNGSEPEPATTLGILIHQGLEGLVKTPEAFHSASGKKNLRQYWRQRLQALLEQPGELDKAIDSIENTLENCLQSAECAWLFNSKLQDDRAEAAVSRLVSGRLYHFVVDRTFIDENGVRWIIDYKTAAPDDSMTTQEFIDLQTRLHASQLATYRQLFEQMESRPVRTALLLTSLPKLLELH